MAGLALAAVPGQIPAQAAPQSGRVTFLVRADIDGHSRLTLWGRSARWYHMSNAAPGRHNGMHDPTIINGKKWFPIWPHPGENRDCHCHSRVFRGVMPRVPVRVAAVRFTAVSCRDSCSIRFRHGILAIDFNDNPSGSDAWYEVKVTFALNAAAAGPGFKPVWHQGAHLTS